MTSIRGPKMNNSTIQRYSVICTYDEDGHPALMTMADGSGKWVKWDDVRPLLDISPLKIGDTVEFTEPSKNAGKTVQVVNVFPGNGVAVESSSEDILCYGEVLAKRAHVKEENLSVLRRI